MKSDTGACSNIMSATPGVESHCSTSSTEPTVHSGTTGMSTLVGRSSSTATRFVTATTSRTTCRNGTTPWRRPTWKCPCTSPTPETAGALVPWRARSTTPTTTPGTARSCGAAGDRTASGTGRCLHRPLCRRGVETVLTAPVTVGTDNTEAMKLTIRVIGSTIDALVNDVVVATATDSTITTGTYAGFVMAPPRCTRRPSTGSTPCLSQRQ